MKSFIEAQFPVSKISKESYKERKAGASQTLTGLGKWWGRKPLILVRAAILGCLMPAGKDPKKDNEIFLKILTMDDDGLMLRKDKNIPAARLYEIVREDRHLHGYLGHFDTTGAKPVLKKGAPRAEIEGAAFLSLGYDAKIALCRRPEQVEMTDEKAWDEINDYLGTNARSLNELIHQLSIMRYGHNVRVGDCFCGGGSVPFEAARMGCEAYGSDLNPVAAMLTWADIHLCGASQEERERIDAFRKTVYDEVREKVEELGIEKNEAGDRAVSYIYCEEAVCPECGMRVPLAPSWVIGKGTKTAARLVKDGDGFAFDVQMGLSKEEMKKAEKGTISKAGMTCPCCGKTTTIPALRKDRVDADGKTVWGLRRWEQSEFEAREDDVFHERLYAIKYERPDGSRYYRAPSPRDLENEEKVRKLVRKNLERWQTEGFVPSMEIEDGDKTRELFHIRGWKYWHQLFNARQLLLLSLFMQGVIRHASDRIELVAGMLGVNKVADWNAKLCAWNSDGANELGTHVFYNQALNPIFNHSCRSTIMMPLSWFYQITETYAKPSDHITLTDARQIGEAVDLWITDPPYADAVYYHELTEFFLAWDKALIPKAFPEWYTDSKRILAVRGDEQFSNTMTEIYANLTRHMSDDGMQVVMFTHSNPAVWAQLALIMWKAGLKVTAAWNIATETESGGLKNGNYVKGTVLLVLRKQTGDGMAFLDELAADIKSEVKGQIDSMQRLDNKEDPNFSDPDFVRAAYGAVVKVFTQYASFDRIDPDKELELAIHHPSDSELVRLMNDAREMALDYLSSSAA